MRYFIYNIDGEKTETDEATFNAHKGGKYLTSVDKITPLKEVERDGP